MKKNDGKILTILIYEKSKNGVLDTLFEPSQLLLASQKVLNQASVQNVRLPTFAADFAASQTELHDVLGPLFAYR